MARNHEAQEEEPMSEPEAMPMDEPEPETMPVAPEDLPTTVSDPDLSGFAVGQAAPRDIYQVFVGGLTEEHLVLSGHMPPGERGYLVAVKGDEVSPSIGVKLGLG
jgi:hypothetical protein